jgi:hypothetical protein
VFTPLRQLLQSPIAYHTAAAPDTTAADLILDIFKVH